MTPALAELLHHPRLWRAGDTRADEHLVAHVRSSGDAELDAWLPGGGWPRGALTELLCEHQGIGELGLLVPLLAGLGAGGEHAALVAPPFIPYAPALGAAGVDLGSLLVVQPRLPVEAAWAAEQLLGSGTCAALVLWLVGRCGDEDMRMLRRLQLAAESGDACAFVFRVCTAARGRGGVHVSPAALRLRLAPCGARGHQLAAARGRRQPRLSLSVLKCRGRLPAAPLAL